MDPGVSQRSSVWRPFLDVVFGSVLADFFVVFLEFLGPWGWPKKRCNFEFYLRNQYKKSESRKADKIEILSFTRGFSIKMTCAKRT